MTRPIRKTLASEVDRARTLTTDFHSACSLPWSGGIRHVDAFPNINRVDGMNSECDRRTSVREYSGSASTEAITECIRFSYGIFEAYRRPVPSAGRIYGLSFFVVDPKSSAISFYDTAKSELTLVRDGAYGEVMEATFFQFTGDPTVVFIFGEVEEYTERYLARGYRFMLLECGHAAQAMLIQFEKNGLRSCPIGAFDDLGIVRIFGQQFTGRVPLYGLAVGKSVEP